MSRKIFVATALAVCLALVFVAISAGDRTRSRDRVVRASMSRTGEVVDIPSTFDERFRRMLPGIPVEIVGSEAGSNPLAVSEERFGINIVDKANSYVQYANNHSDDVVAHDALTTVLEMGLENVGTTKSERVLASTYESLARLHDGEPSRQAYLLGKALEFTEPQSLRSELEAKIVEAGVATAASDFAYDREGRTQTVETRDFGPDDSCAGGAPVGVPSITNMDFAGPTDVNYLQVTIAGPLGQALEIETTSPDCDGEASCSAPQFDTDMNLWARCDNGFADDLVARDINQGDGGVGWLSKIQTECLLPGTYYLEVKGQFGSTPMNIDVEVRETGSCVVPTPDAYEIDDTVADANSIGSPTSLPTSANGWGRQRKEIQDHSIFPPNDDDHVLVKITDKTALIEVGAQTGFASVWGGFNIPSGPDGDSQLIMFYGQDPHGGICNAAPLAIPNNYCKSSGDCDPNATPADPSRPADECIPLWQLQVPGEAGSRFKPNNPLLFNDDVDPASNLGSAINACLPRTQPSQGPALVANGGGFAFRARGYRPPFPGSVSGLAYDYQTRALNTGPCLYENEPNQSFPDASPIVANMPVNGMWEGSETYPLSDVDIWGPFDLDGTAPQRVSIDVLPEMVNPLVGKATLALWVGPDDNGNYVEVPTTDEGTAPNGRVSLILPPADLYLGNMMADAGYFAVVSTDDVIPNFYYTVRVVTPRIDVTEVEPNDNLWAPQNVGYRGLTIIDGAIQASCDIDRYQFTVAENQFLDMWTSDPGTDTVMNFQRLIGAYGVNILSGSAAGQYPAGTAAAIGPPATAQNFNGPTEVAQDDDGSADNRDACGPLVNDMTGKVCLVIRGACAFVTKNLNCQAAGATAVLLSNDGRNDNGVPPGMGGDCGGLCEIPMLSLSSQDGLPLLADPAPVAAIDDEQLACDDDGFTQFGNPYLSRITGCVGPGDYLVSVRGWNQTGGPYILTVGGLPGCVPTEPPSMNSTGENSSAFCPPVWPFERLCQ